MEQDALIDFLKTISYFQALPMPIINDLAAEFESEYILGGQTLINQGDAGDCLYIIQSGRLRASKCLEDGTETVIADMLRGELIGELALFTEAPRAATVIAVRDCVLWKLSKASFNAFVQQHPTHIMPMVKSAILRLLHPAKNRTSTCNAIALVPAGQSTLDTLFIRALIDEYTRIGPTLYLNLNTLQAQFSTMDLKASNSRELFDPKIADWLSVQERTHKHLIYEVDASNPNWTDLCIRQVDKIILFSESNGSTDLGEIEKHIFSTQNKIPYNIELVLLHNPSSGSPKNTRDWLEKRNVPVHHVKKGHLNDIKRLVRMITGGEIALVLGGGGAKGLGHLGVYKALNELGIPIDRVCGTSMGALMAAFIAMDLSVEEITSSITINIINNKKFNDYTIPTVALLGGVGWLNAMKKGYGETRCIEDLWRSFFCIASNFTQRKQDIIERGLIYKAIRATTSLPGIVPPISNERNELLIDGGIFNNLPVDVMREKAPSSRIIAVRVSPTNNHHAHIPDGIASGLKRFVWNSTPKADPLQKSVPGIGEIIASSVVLCNDEKEEKMLRSADYQMDMNFSSYAMLDFSKLPQLIELGYNEAMEYFTKKPIIVP